MRQSGGGKSATDAALADNLEKMGSMAPQDADEWLSSFITFAETWPACIVVSDMTIPGAPMGPDTEPESIQVIQETLCKGEDCHVLLTNYRKSGDKFKNLLSMRPVYDADDVYRYTIGVQFEVEKDNSPAKLQQLNKLLQMLPKKLNLRSAKDAAMGKMLADFAAEHGSPLTQTHVQFAREAADVLRDDLESKASKKQLRKLHLRMRHNPIFYCTRTEIVIGDIDETAWEPIRKEVAWGLDVSTKFLAADLLPRPRDGAVPHREIVDAARECKGLAVKLTNVKKDGSAFQCYLALHPVFGANGEYLYQLKTLELLLSLLPSSLLCDSSSDYRRVLRLTPNGGDCSGDALPARRRARRAGGVAAPPVRTAAGEDRDMYGKKLGKKHADALLKLNESAWLTDADASLRALLSKMEGRAAFTAFLATEYNEQSLDFVLEAQKLSRKKLNEKKQVQEAQVLYDKYLAKNPGNRDGSRGIGQADRTRARASSGRRRRPRP
ncbi:hypothetical protein SO694_00043059 [Aureococcus anophagefferens]|uniref:RGS domain-containing protein n=1 Tax=Aureococcus anophagefferens TaxID=44056 RepID=A0ABR1G759_AURAN